MANENAGTIEEIIVDFVQEVRKNFRIDAVYWFGSTSRGAGDQYSDIDIALVSPDFSGDRFDDVCRLIPIKIKFDSRIEVHPFRSDDFREGTMMSLEIERTGKKIA
jgi:predicted nucleotidyltransferase